MDINELLESFFGKDYLEKVPKEKISQFHIAKNRLMSPATELDTQSVKLYSPIKTDTHHGSITFPAFHPPKSQGLQLDVISKAIHKNNVEAGWWNDLHTGEPLRRNKHEILGLIASELYEAFEGERKDKQDTHLPQYKNSCVEMADAIIRIFDYCGKYQVNPAYLIQDDFENNNLMAMTRYPDIVSQNIEKLEAESFAISPQSLFHLESVKNYCHNLTNLNTKDSDGNIFSKIFRISSLLGLLSFVEINEKDTKELENIIISSVFIMILDYCCRQKYEVINAMVDKLIYNRHRVDHKKESRLKSDGKKN